MSMTYIDRIRTPRTALSACLALALAVAPSVVDAQSSTRRENGVTRAARARAERAATQGRTPARLTSNNASAAKVTGATTVAAPATGAVPAAPGSFDAFLRAVNDLPALSNRFVRIPALRPEQITLVDVRNVFRASQEQERFETVLQEQDRRITAMRSTLQNSMTLRDLLYERQIAMSQVVAVDVLPDGRGTVVYYRAD